MEGRIMAAQTQKSRTERELEAYTDELCIRHHAARLEANFGSDCVLKALEEVARAIQARRPSLQAGRLRIPAASARQTIATVTCSCSGSGVRTKFCFCPS